jgi:hypothetical protein
LDKETLALAYSACETARQSIYAEWMQATDPRRLQPEVPKAIRDAANIVTTAQPAGMGREDADRLVAALLAPYPPRIRAVFRAVLRTDAREQRKADRVAEEAARLGLEPSPPPEPLPVITEEDIHLVCWQAITPADTAPGPEVGAVEQADLLAPEQTVLGP